MFLTFHKLNTLSNQDLQQEAGKKSPLRCRDAPRMLTVLISKGLMKFAYLGIHMFLVYINHMILFCIWLFCSHYICEIHSYCCETIKCEIVHSHFYLIPLYVHSPTYPIIGWWTLGQLVVLVTGWLNSCCKHFNTQSGKPKYTSRQSVYLMRELLHYRAWLCLVY